MPALTEKDKQEGKELIDMLESLPVEEKKQARIYIGALHDRQMILKEQQEEEVVQMARPRGTDSARVVRVIVTESLRGEGTQEDPCRTVTQYWDFDGNLLAENDPCEKEKEQFPTQFSYANFVFAH